MLHAVDLFRSWFGARPLFLTGALFGIVLLVVRAAGARRAAATLDRAFIVLFVAAGVTGAIAYPALAIGYARDPHFFDNAEPTMAAVAWMFDVGRPLYPSVDAAERYAHIYGPAAFIIQGAALSWLGPSILVSKAAGAAAGIAGLGFLFAALRRYATGGRAAVLTGAGAVLLLMFRSVSFWNRPDALQLLGVSAALCFAGARAGVWSTLMVGVAAGLLWDLKFTGPLYTLPVLALLYRRAGVRGVALATGTAAVTAVVPFVIFPNVSMASYVAWVRLSSGTGLLLSMLRQNIEWAAFLSAPLLLVRHVSGAPHTGRGALRLEHAALLIGICGVVLAAAKPGAGPYHLMPFVPIVVGLVAQRVGRDRVGGLDPLAVPAAVAFIVAALLIALAQQVQLVTTLQARRETRDVEDITRFLATHDGVVEMAYGTSETLSLSRPLLVFRNESYLIDQPAVREQQLQRVALPDATVEAVAACRVRYWLVPRGEPPFSGLNGYAAAFLRPLYPDRLRRRFAETHVLAGSTTYFDVWECRGAAVR